jgi:hypothetical protein
MIVALKQRKYKNRLRWSKANLLLDMFTSRFLTRLTSILPATWEADKRGS